MSERYSRQSLFKDIGKEGQIKIEDSSVAIIGVGALGSVSSELLTRAGIGEIMIVDADKVEESNLQRQALYKESDVGTSKVLALKKHLEHINKNVKITAINERLTKDNIEKIKADVIVDGTDNMETRFLINEYAKKNKIPFVYGSAAGSVGIIYNILNDGPCFYCIFKNSKSFATCHTEGVINTATHMVGSMQAAEVLKIILDKNPEKDLLRFDAWHNTYEKYKVNKDKDCHVCNGNYTLLEGKEDDFIISECKTKSSFLAKPRKKIRLDIRKITKEFKTLQDAGIIAVIDVDGEEIIVHDYGELVFKTKTNVKEIRDIAQKIYGIGKI